MRCPALARLLLRYENAALRERAKELAAGYLDAVLSQCQAKHQEACRELVSVKYPSTWEEFELAERFAEVVSGYGAPPGTEPTVFKVLDLACAAGERAACTELGAGWAVQGFRAKAEPLLVAVCDAGDQRGCLELANFWGMGNPKASQLLHKACDYGFVSACASLAREHPKLRRRACQLGQCEEGTDLEPELTCVAGQRDCAKVLERARQPLTAPCRFELLREACGQGASASCGELGESYRSGNGVAKDPVLAAKALEAACRGPVLSDEAYDGSAWCDRLASYRERGDGVVRDSRKAAWGYADLCLTGSLGACDAIERVVGRTFARGAYGPVGVGERRCALLPEGFACENHGV